MRARSKDVIRLAVGADETPGGFERGRCGRPAGGWRNCWSSSRDRPSSRRLEVPDGFCGTLRPYQKRGYSWLAFLRRWGLGACLADDMGLGKTVQTLAAVQQDRREGAKGTGAAGLPDLGAQQLAQGSGPVHARAAAAGASRSRPQAGRRIRRGGSASRPLSLPATGCWLGTCGFMSEVPWRGVVLDEAQNIKNPATRQAREPPGRWKPTTGWR